MCLSVDLWHAGGVKRPLQLFLSYDNVHVAVLAGLHHRDFPLSREMITSFLMTGVAGLRERRGM